MKGGEQRVIPHWMGQSATVSKTPKWPPLTHWDQPSIELSNTSELQPLPASQPLAVALLIPLV